MKKSLLLCMVAFFTLLTFHFLAMAVTGDASVGVLHLGVPPMLAIVCGDLAFTGSNKEI